MLLGAVGVLLCRMTGRPEVVVACNIANRIRQEHEELVGLFVNNVALRLRCATGGSFADVVDGTGRTFFAAVDHQEYPISMVKADRAGQDADTGARFPQVIVVMQNQPAPVLDLPGLTSEVHDVAVNGSRSGLLLVLVPDDDGIECVLDFATDLFDAGMVERWSGAYIDLLHELVRSPTTPLPAGPAVPAAAG